MAIKKNISFPTHTNTHKGFFNALKDQLTLVFYFNGNSWACLEEIWNSNYINSDLLIWLPPPNAARFIFRNEKKKHKLPDTPIDMNNKDRNEDLEINYKMN